MTAHLAIVEGLAGLEVVLVTLLGSIQQVAAHIPRGWNIHTFVNFDEFFANLSPNSIRDRGIHDSITQNLNKCSQI